MPFNMFKAFSGSRNRTHRGDPSVYTEFPQGYPPATDFQPEPMDRSQPRVLRRSSTKRREPLFTPLPSRTPTDAEDYNEGYIRVDNPDAVMGGALNARPPKLASALPPLGLGSAVENLSETLSEREHRERAERLHDVPRLLDRPPQLQRAGSYHSGHAERVNPDEPIIMSPSPSRSSGSDRTIEALRTPLSMHPSDRVIPPLPRNYPGGYVSGSRSPTDIYGSHPYEVVHDVHSHHYPEIHLDGHGRASGYEKEGPIYYIIPGGMNVILQDEHGNEITRVGDFSGRSRPPRPGPFVVQDEHGRELYRYDGHDRGSRRGHGEPQIVRIDAYSSSGQPRQDRHYSSHGYPSHGRGYDYHPDRREYRDGRERDWHDHPDHRYRGYADHPNYNKERDWRDHRDHRHRGYADYPGYSEYRDHGGYRDPSTHRDHGGYKEHGGYREHGDHKLHGRSEISTPGRVSSRASHRTYNHSGQMSLERPPQQYSNSISDDRRSERDYAASHGSMRHQEDEAVLSGGLQELHI